MSAIYLKKIVMQDLFGYKNVTWEVFRDVNILGGDNGSGKSTIFHICYQLLAFGYIADPHYAYLAESVELTMDNDWRLLWDKQRVSKDTEHESGYNYYNIEANKVEKDGTFLVQRVRVVDNDSNVVAPDDLIKTVLTSFASSFEQNILEAQRNQGDKGQPSDDRTYLDVMLSSAIARRNERVSQIFYDSLSKASEQKMEGSSQPIYLNAKDTEYISAFNDALKEFFGNHYAIKAGMEAKISFTNRKSGEVVKYQDLSLGEKEMLFLIVITSNMFDAPVLLWLDEPDLGLHVDWQEKLITTLQRLNPNMQLFVSTHAPSMIVGNQGRVAEMSEIEAERYGQ